MRYGMIMAGGAGTRLWPLSRRKRPKQLLPFIGHESLLALAAGRLEGVVDAERRYICTNESHRAVVSTQMPEFAPERILGEPVGRDTVNAVAFTAAVLAKQDPDAVFAVLTSDHVIEPQDEFAAKLDLAFRLVEDDARRFVTFAIRPTFAATQYGWVKRGAPLDGFAPAARAADFDEKPDQRLARAYLADESWGWNSGMFVYHAQSFLDALERMVPESRAGVARIAEAWGTAEQASVLEAVYPTLPKVSVDYAVMKPAASDAAIDICVVPMDVSWLDVGSWPSYAETLDADDDGNAAHGASLHLGSTNVVTVSDDPDHLVATIDCHDLIVVHADDATLVCPRASAQKVKALVERLDDARR